MARSDLIAFALLFSLLSALLSNYYFGTGDHVDHLSIQYRLTNPGFLAQDALVELNQGFNPRFYYTRLIHLSNGLMPVHAAYAILYLLTHAAIILITALATRDLTGSSPGGLLGRYDMRLRPHPVHHLRLRRQSNRKPDHLALPGAALHPVRPLAGHGRQNHRLELHPGDSPSPDPRYNGRSLEPRCKRRPRKAATFGARPSDPCRSHHLRLAASPAT